VTSVYLSPESELTTERWRNTLESEIYPGSLIGVAVDSIVLPNEAVPNNDEIVQLFVLFEFVCGIFLILVV